MSERNARTRGYTTHVARPSRQRLISARGLAALVLTVLLPPVGLMLMWTQGVFTARGRALLTTLATVEMTAVCVWLTPHQELAPQRPVPAPPAAVTAAPEGENLDALYNIEELIYEQQLASVIEAGGTERDLLTEEQKLAEVEARNQQIMDTVVYSVYNEAKYYHADRVCRTQTNGRQLTIREAMQEGLAPCPNCNPPVISG